MFKIVALTGALAAVSQAWEWEQPQQQQQYIPQGGTGYYYNTPAANPNPYGTGAFIPSQYQQADNYFDDYTPAVNSYPS